MSQPCRKFGESTGRGARQRERKEREEERGGEWKGENEELTVSQLCRKFAGSRGRERSRNVAAREKDDGGRQRGRESGEKKERTYCTPAVSRVCGKQRQ